MWRKLAIAVAVVLMAAPALAEVPVPPPVAVVVGGGMLPIFVSRDWSQSQPAVRRVVVVVHGYERNAADYARNMMGFGAPDDTMVIAPQFLAPADIAAHQLPDTVLRWNREVWAVGNPAEGPAPVSAFDALDAVLTKLADRNIFPNLSQIVLTGFSAGGQVMQRYAIVGKGEMALGRIDVRVRSVIGSPSSYTYFNDERPLPDGSFGAFTAAACPGFNRWRYGFAGDLPPYVAAVAAL